MAINASNVYNVEATRGPISVDFNAPYAPTTQTYHGFSIQVDGRTIGRITDWTPVGLTRTINHVFELNAKTFGQPVDAVPGVEGTFTTAFTRAEIWGEEIEKAFGETDVYTLLVNQTKPFIIDEVYTKGGGQLYRMYRYLGCWFSSKTVNAFAGDGDAIIKVDGEITFVNRVRLI